MMKTPQESFQEREQRVNDAVALKEPDRLPVMCLRRLFPCVLCRRHVSGDYV